jgi:hypothetical protein
LIYKLPKFERRIYINKMDIAGVPTTNTTTDNNNNDKTPTTQTTQQTSAAAAASTISISDLANIMKAQGLSQVKTNNNINKFDFFF